MQQSWNTMIRRMSRLIAFLAGIEATASTLARADVNVYRDSAEYVRLIVRACRRYNIAFALVKAVIKAESAFNPRALSSAGARGLMQLMPETAARHGVTDINSPRDNIRGRVRHLRYLRDHFRGNISLVLAAYDA
jgi:soluble lytic murein transglycosylase-like protein